MRSIFSWLGGRRIAQGMMRTKCLSKWIRAGRRSARLAFEEETDRAVVDQFDVHHGTEFAGLNSGTAVSKKEEEALI